MRVCARQTAISAMLRQRAKAGLFAMYITPMPELPDPRFKSSQLPLDVCDGRFAAAAAPPCSMPRLLSWSTSGPAKPPPLPLARRSG